MANLTLSTSTKCYLCREFYIIYPIIDHCKVKMQTWQQRMPLKLVTGAFLLYIKSCNNNYECQLTLGKSKYSWNHAKLKSDKSNAF